MGNTATRNAREQRNNRQLSVVAAAAAVGEDEVGSENHSQSGSNKAKKSSIATTTTSNSTTEAGAPGKRTTTTTRKYVTKDGAGAASAAAVTAQRQRQASVWSLGSLSGRFNWSFSGVGASKAGSASFHSRSKVARKRSLSSVQLKRSRTAWHRPVTSTIFSTHFKTTSRNDEFSIVHLIAKGAFGVVFKVTDKQQRDHQPAFYALKVLKKSNIIVGNGVEQLKDEADIQKACGHHPFIVQQIDSWQNRHNLHILSEYLPNGELFSKFASFSLDLVRLYLAEIALAIDFLHNAGIIYRDAKSENILLTHDYHIKLTDFGLSKWLKLGANTKTMCGTLQYMGTI